MTGVVDSSGRALVPICLRHPTARTQVELQAWIDTAFTGELALPDVQIAFLGLLPASIVTATLGDGSEAVLSTYTCLAEWFSESKEVEAIANKGLFPLLGVGLLAGHRLTIDYHTCESKIE